MMYSEPITQNCVPETPTTAPYVESQEVSDTKVLMSELFYHFYSLGWLSGTGGSITIEVNDHSIPRPHQLIVMSPSARA